MHIKLVLSQLSDWKFESNFSKHAKKQKYLKAIGDMGRIAEAANVMVRVSLFTLFFSEIYHENLKF